MWQKKSDIQELKNKTKNSNTTSSTTRLVLLVIGLEFSKLGRRTVNIM